VAGIVDDCWRPRLLLRVIMEVVSRDSSFCIALCIWILVEGFQASWEHTHLQKFYLLYSISAARIGREGNV
jgi:hypothetical protein